MLLAVLVWQIRGIVLSIGWQIGGRQAPLVPHRGGSCSSRLLPTFPSQRQALLLRGLCCPRCTELLLVLASLTVERDCSHEAGLAV